MQNQIKWRQHLENAREHLKIADRMAYVSLTILKDNRLLIKILQELADSVVELIKAFLYYEHAFKRVKLYKTPQMNLKTFKEKIALRYLDKKDIINLIKILKINKKHEHASLEFVRRDKFVIFLGDTYEIIDVNKIREFLVCVKRSIESFPEKFL